MQTKKGFILIYTVLVGIICLIIMMYIFDIQMEEVKYSSSNKRYILNEDNYQKGILKEDNYQRDKEYLMTLFFTYINENKAIIKSLGIDVFFHDFTSGKVKYGLAKVSYSIETKKFSFTTPYEILTDRNDYYKLEVIGDSFQMIYINTLYSNKWGG